MSEDGRPGALLGELVVLDDIGPERGRPGHRAAIATTALLGAAAVLVGALVLWPVVRTAHASVTGDRGEFVGWAHFRATWDAGAGEVLVQTLAWAVVVPLAVTALGLLLALLSRRRPGHGRVFTSILIGPVALPLVVTGIAFRLLYDPNPARGTATRLATALPGDVVPLWLGPRWITLALMSAFAWVWIGLAFVVFRAALDQLPHELADTVRAYGGSPWETLRDGLWLPLLRRIVTIVLALVALSTVRTFDLMLTMAPASVLDDASVLAVMQWQTSGAATSGPAAALGVLWLAAVAAGVLLVAWWSRPAQRRRPRRARRASAAPAAVTSSLSRSQGPPSGGRRLNASRVAGAVAAGSVIVWIVPLLVLVATSLHAPREAATEGWWSPPFGLGSYGRLDATGIVASLRLTAILALVVTAAVIAVAVLAIRALAEMPPAGAQATIVVLLAAAVVPVQVVAGPITEVLDWARLSGQMNPLRLVFVHVALTVPLAVLVLWNARARLSFARIKETWQTAPTRGRPLRERVRSTLDAEPAVVAVFVLVFVQVWNDFVVGLFFGGPHAVPLGLRLYGETRQFVANTGVLAAGSVVASIVPLLIVVLNHRRVVAGLIGRSYATGHRAA